MLENGLGNWLTVQVLTMTDRSRKEGRSFSKKLKTVGMKERIQSLWVSMDLLLDMREARKATTSNY